MQQKELGDIYIEAIRCTIWYSVWQLTGLPILELKYYLSHSRPLFFDDNLQTNADLVIDGMLTTEDKIKYIKEYLKRERS